MIETSDAKSEELSGDRFGMHRVLAPDGVLPQAAERLDADFSKCFDNEIVVDVERLNIDSASFVQMEAEGEVGAQVLATVRARGKQHNRVTGSGGMLLGRIARVGGRVAARGVLGERVASLVSLTLTPLALERVVAVDGARHQLEVVGRAVLFESSAFARLPADLPERVALSAFDVAGAAPQVARLVRVHLAAHGAAPRVLILGCGGKSGLLCGAAARRAGAALVVGVERSDEAARAPRALGAFDAVLVGSAAHALPCARAALAAGGGEFDLTVSCVNVPDAEMAAILATRDGGTIYFFSMSTSFTKAALGAEGVSRDVAMLVGNGYAPNHADETLALLRADSALREIFLRRYS